LDWAYVRRWLEPSEVSLAESGNRLDDEAVLRRLLDR